MIPSPEHDIETAFDDAGEAVPWVGFDFGAVDPADTVPEELATQSDALRMEQHDRLRLVQMTLRMLQANSSDPETVGRKAMIFLNLLCRDETQAALAKRMGLSTGRLSEVKTIVANEFKAFSHVLIRAAEHPPVGDRT